MKTFDYECKACGFTSEYRVPDSSAEPSCFKCGGDTRRLPSGFNIGGNSMRKATMDDVYAPQHGLEISLGVAECECGEEVPVIGLRPFEIPGSPNMN